jgi:hypothetical protein
MMTAAHIAVAIVAACGVTGTKPERAFDNGDGQGRTRVMAAAGLMARLGWPKAETARLFRVHPNRLTPSGLGVARVGTNHLLIVAEALAAHGLCQPDNARARFLRPYGPGVTAEGGPADHSTQVSRDLAAEAATPQRKASGSEAAASAELRTVSPRPTASAARPDCLKTGRLKPVTDRVIRWARQQMALGADVDFLAWCFNVDVEVLAERVRPVQAVAA